MNALGEPGLLTSRLVAELGAEMGIPRPTVSHVELWINQVYQGLYETKQLTPVNGTIFKIDSDAPPDQADVLERTFNDSSLDWGAYNRYSQLGSFMAVKDVRVHNYGLLRDRANKFSPFLWDADHVLGNAPVAQKQARFQEVFMQGRLTVAEKLPVEMWMQLSNMHDLFDPIRKPVDLTVYFEEYLHAITTGPLSQLRLTSTVHRIAQE
ncbi:hypothetical protein TrCOL_g4306, partial [Triparma columacea]